jgi:hypothetical protein
MEQCIARYVFLYNQRDATYSMFFIIIGALHVSGGFSAHHQEIIRRVETVQFQPVHTSGRQQESMTMPKAAHTVL